jgi:hypothetical protein
MQTSSAEDPQTSTSLVTGEREERCSSLFYLKRNRSLICLCSKNLLTSILFTTKLNKLEAHGNDASRMIVPEFAPERRTGKASQEPRIIYYTQNFFKTAQEVFPNA